MIAEPNCFKRKCKHFTGVIDDSGIDEVEVNERPACKAYPEGIPSDIAYGRAKHLKVRSDQNNKIVFEKGDRK